MEIYVIHFDHMIKALHVHIRMTGEYMRSCISNSLFHSQISSEKNKLQSMHKILFSVEECLC